MVVEKDLSNLEVRVIKIPLGAKFILIPPLPPLGHWLEPLGFYSDINDFFIFEDSFFYDDEILLTWSKSENVTSEDNVYNKHKKETVDFYQSDLQAEAGANINSQPSPTDKSTTIENIACKPPLGISTPLSNVLLLLSEHLVAYLTSEIESVNQIIQLSANNLNNEELAVKLFNQSNKQIAPLAEAEVKLKEQEVSSRVEANNEKPSNTTVEKIVNSLAEADSDLILNQDDVRTFTNLTTVENLEDTIVSEITSTSVQQAQAYPNLNTQLDDFEQDLAQTSLPHLESAHSLELNLPSSSNKSPGETENLENNITQSNRITKDNTSTPHSSNDETQPIKSLQAEPILDETDSSTDSPDSPDNNYTKASTTRTDIFLPLYEESLTSPVIEEIETNTDATQTQVETPVLDSSQAQKSQIDFLQTETETPYVATLQTNSESLQLITLQLELPNSDTYDNTNVFPSANVEASVGDQPQSQPITIDQDAPLNILNDTGRAVSNSLQSTPGTIDELSTASQPTPPNINTAFEASQIQSALHKNRQILSADVDIFKNSEESFDISDNQPDAPNAQLEIQSLQDLQASSEEAFQRNAVSSKNIETVTIQTEIETTLGVSNPWYTESTVEENIDASNQKTIVEVQPNSDAQVVLSLPTIEISEENASILSDTTPKNNLPRANPEIDVAATQYNNQQQESVELQANKLNSISESINSGEHDKIIYLNKTSVISPDTSNSREFETTEQSYNSVVENIQNTTETSITTEQSDDSVTHNIQATIEIDTTTEQLYNFTVKNIQATTEIDTTTEQLYNLAVDNIQATTEIDTTTEQLYNLAVDNIQVTTEIDTTAEQLHNPAAQNIQATTEIDATTEQSYNPIAQNIQATTKIKLDESKFLTTTDKLIYQDVSENTSFSDSQLMQQVGETANIELISRDNRPQKSLDQQPIVLEPFKLDNEVKVIDTQNNSVAETITSDTSFIEPKQIIQNTSPNSKDAKSVSSVITESNTGTQPVQNTTSKLAIQPNHEFSQKPPSKIEKTSNEQQIYNSTHPDEKDVLTASLQSTQQQAPRQQLENTTAHDITKDDALQVQAETTVTSQKPENLENHKIAPLLLNNLNTLTKRPLGHKAPLSDYLGLLSELFKDTNTSTYMEMLSSESVHNLDAVEQTKNQEQTQQASDSYHAEPSGTNPTTDYKQVPSIFPSWLIESFERIKQFDLSNSSLLASLLTQSELHDIISEGEIGANISNNESELEILDTNQDFPDEWSSISELLDFTSNNTDKSLPPLNVLNVNPPIQIINSLSSFFDNFIDMEVKQNQEAQAQVMHSSEQYTPNSWSNIAELLGESLNSEVYNNQFNEENVLETVNTDEFVNSVESSLSSPDTQELTSEEESIILQAPDVEVNTSSLTEEEIEFLAHQVYNILQHRLKMNQSSQFLYGANTYDTWNKNFWDSEALFRYKQWRNPNISTISLNSNLSTLVEEVYTLVKYQLTPNESGVESNFYSLML